MKVTENIEIYNESCFHRMSLIESCSIDIICIDPPYLYLKHKLDAPFDEPLFFNECKRLLTKNGFIILFGRGASFYRWGAMLDGLGFTFKEEIIWDKSQSSSPLMALSRVHETVSIWTKGKGTINKCKIPYVEMKGHDIDSIIADVKRLKTTFKNTKSLNAVLEFLENNTGDKSYSQPITRSDRQESETFTKHGVNSDKRRVGDRSVNVIQSVQFGLNEKSIVRTDFEKKTQKHKIGESDRVQDYDRCVNVAQSLCFGLNEKSIIHQKQGVTISSDALTFIKSYYYELLELLQQNGKATIYEELRNHYSSIHPTEKPVRLLERLIQLVIPKHKTNIIVADWFGGSYNTMKAVHNLGLKGISTEILEEYHKSGMESLKEHCKQLNLFAS